ncbi:MAG: AAA family ATPase [Planctomycetaceae bacterium]
MITTDRHHGNGFQPGSNHDSDRHRASIPPQHLDSERAILGGAIVCDKARREILGSVVPTQLYLDINANVLRIIARLDFDGKLTGDAKANTTTILVAVDDSGICEDITGGIGLYLNELINSHEPHFVDYHCRKVVKAALQRKLISDLEESTRLAWAGESAEDICQRLMDTAGTIQKGLAPPADEWISSKDFAATKYSTEYFIPGILAKQQFTIVGGPSKGCKTTTLCELGLSIASGDKFCNEFYVTRPVNVGMVSAESGPGTLQETAFRIAKSKHIKDLGDYERLFWKFNLPILTEPTAISRLIAWVNSKSLEVLILDPFYLMAGLTENASNMFVVGPLLASLQTVGEITGVTIIIAHHFRNLQFIEQYAPPELGMLAWSGFSQYARQWILLNRREKYDAETGLHKLWLGVGGSAGHGGLFAIDAYEGRQENPGGRVWEVSVSKASDARKQEREEKEQKKSEEQQTKLQKDTDSVVSVMEKHLDGISKSLLRDISGVGAKINEIIPSLVQQQRIEPCRFKASNSQTYQGFKLTRTLGQTLGQTQPSDCPTDTAHTLGQRPPLRGRVRPSGVCGGDTDSVECEILSECPSPEEIDRAFGGQAT